MDAPNEHSQSQPVYNWRTYLYLLVLLFLDLIGLPPSSTPVAAATRRDLPRVGVQAFTGHSSLPRNGSLVDRALVLLLILDASYPVPTASGSQSPMYIPSHPQISQSGQLHFLVFFTFPLPKSRHNRVTVYSPTSFSFAYRPSSWPTNAGATVVFTFNPSRLH